MKLRKAALWIAAAALAAPMAFAAGPVKPGKWQTTMEMEMAGMPMKMPPVTTTQCITKEMAENPQSTLPKASRNADSDCKISDYKIEGRTVSWTISCPKEKVSGTGSMTYSDASYTGEMHMKADEHEMTMKYKGKYLGACE